MRISSASLIFSILALAGCDERPDDGRQAVSEEGMTSENADDGRVACALSGAEVFVRDCKIEQLNGGGQNVLIIRHPDGGFRRFNIVPGMGVEAADGAEVAEVSIIDDKMIEVAVGADRYRLPARMKASTASADAEGSE